MASPALKCVPGSVVTITDVVTSSVAVTPGNPTGLVDATTETATIYAPDNTTITPTVTRLSLGTYTFQFTASLPGNYTARTVGTGPGAGAGEIVILVERSPSV